MREKAQSITELYQSLRPLILRDVGIAGNGARSVSGMEAHALSGAWHTGTLLEPQAPWAATKADLATLEASELLHSRVHVLATTAGLGADHTVSGLTSGQYLRAAGATTAAFSSIQDADLPATIVRTSRNIASGAGLTGGGNLSADLTLAVGAGLGITVNADDVALAASVAGDGLTYTSGVLSLTLSGTSGLELAGTTPNKTLQLADDVAGNGLSIASKQLAVGVATTIQSAAGAGLSVEANAVRLTAGHNPGATTSILASDATGKLTLPLMVVSTSLSTPLAISGAGQSLTLQPAADLIFDPASNLARMGAGVSVQASSYASQTTGWRVTDVGEADFRYLFADEMHVKSFIADLEQALAGGQIIAKSVAVVATEFTLPAAGASGTLRVRDLPSAPNMAVFESGDFIGLRQFSRAGGSLSIGWAWGTVTSYADGTAGNEGTQTWTFARHAGTPGSASGTIAAEAIVLDFGVSGNGFYEVNAIDGLYGANSPYAQVVTWAAHPATQTVRARFGNLRGIFSVADEYGIYAGSGTSVTSRYVRASSSVIEFRNVPLSMYDGTNNTLLLSAGASNNSPFMALGSPLPTGPLVNDGIWLGKDGAVYELRVGTVSGGALVKGLHWDGANLVWKATNTALDASGNLTATSATLSGTVTASAGAIGGWSISASGLTATNIGLYSGAANTARVQVGSGSDVAGINATAASGDIAFWAGDTHANRAIAEFRVTAGGALTATGATITGAITATSGTITGDFSVTSGGKLTASGGGIVLTATGINVGLYTSINGGVAPPDEAKAIAWYDTPSTATGLQVRQYVGKATDGTPHWNVTVNPSGASPLTMTLWEGGAGYNALRFANLEEVVGLPGLYLANGTPKTVTVLTGARLNLESGSSFVAYSDLLPGTDVTYNLGSGVKRWGTVYADNMVISGSISGTTLDGAEWEYAGSMTIDANAASNTTVTIVNQNGSYTASLDVENNITLGGTVDGVDLASFKSTYDAHAADVNAHHTRSHAITSTSDHSASGLTAGWVLRASGATTFAWAQLAHSDLSGDGTNSHATIDSHLAATAAHGATGAVVGTTNTQTLTNKTLTTPTIGDFTNAQHAHTNAASGGTISHGSLTGIGANDHHAQSHVLATNLALGADHTISGATAGHVLRASGPTAAAFAAIQDADLPATIVRTSRTLTAGAGLTGTSTLASDVTFAVGAGLGITVNADDVALTTPGTLTAATTNSSTGSHTHAITTGAASTLTVATTNTTGAGAALARADHTHAITSSSNPGAAASLLASNASGYLRLVRLGVGIDPTVPLHVSGNIKATGSIDADVQFLGQATDSATAPSFSWTADTNTGIFQPAADTLALTTAGVERFRITSAGKVGIGVTPTVGILDVSPPAATPAIVINRASAQPSIKAGVADGYMIIDSTGQQLRLNNFVANDVTIASGGGRVAIGSVTAPSYKLDVTGDIRSTGDLFVDGGMVDLSGSGIIDFGTNTITEDATNLKITGAKSVLLAQTIQASGWSITTGGALVSASSLSAASMALTGAATITGSLTVGTYNGGTLQVNSAGYRVGINRAADSQFDLDVAGAIRGQYLVGKHALQLDNAYALIHFDGPAPYNLDFTGTSTSHMGSVATETGGVIYRPGLYGKAIQLAEATTNLVTNPSYDSATTGWSTVSGYTHALNTDDGFVGGTCLALTSTVTGSPYVYSSYGTDLATGDSFAFSVHVKAGSVGAVGKTIRIILRENSSGSHQTSVNYTLTAEWQRIWVVRTLTHDTPTALNYFFYMDGAVPGDVLLVDGVQLEKKAYITSYCDGSLGAGHSWSGTAHASTSSRTAGSIDFGNIVNRSQYTIAGWFKMSMPENQTITSAWRPTFFQVGTYNTNPSMRLGTYSTNTNIRMYSRNTTAAGWTISGASAADVDYVAGDWVFVAVTYDGTKHVVYAQRAGQDTILTTTMADTPEHYGYGERLRLAIDASLGLDLVDEVIVLDVAADAKLIRSIYHSNAPVFAESSVVSFRSPSKAAIWVDEFGLWGRGVSGGEIIGIYGGNPRWKTGDPPDEKSWGGIPMQENDLVIGRTSAPSYTALHWDDSAGELILGRQAGEHVSLTSGFVRIKNNTTTYAQLAAGVLSLGDTGAEHVLVDTTGVTLKDNATTYAKFAATTTIGVTTLEHVLINSDSIQLKINTSVYADLTAGVLSLGLTTAEHALINSSGIALKDNTTTYAQFAATTTIGATTGEHVSITSSTMQFKDGATVYAQLTGGSLTLGLTTAEHVLVNTSGVALKDNTTVYAQFAATTTIGATATEHVSITSSTMQFKDGATNVYTELTGGVLTLGLVSSGDYATVDATNGIRLYGAGTMLGQWTATGGVVIGEVAASKGNVAITAGAVSVRLNTTERIGLSSAGVLTIKDSAGAAVFTLDASSGAEFTRPLTIGTLGGIYQGTGTFAAPTTGLKVWTDFATGTGRIGGYNSGTLQWYAGTDGKLYAGGGNVLLDTAGIQMAYAASGAHLKVVNGSATIFDLYSTTESSQANTFLKFYPISDSPGGNLVIAAHNAAGVEQGRMQFSNDGGINLSGSGTVVFNKLVSVNNTLEITNNNLLSVNGSVLLVEQASAPSSPTSGTQARLYMKGDKLIIQYNDGGTTRYKYLDLTGTGVTWVHTTTAP